MRQRVTRPAEAQCRCWPPAEGSPRLSCCLSARAHACAPVAQSGIHGDQHSLILDWAREYGSLGSGANGNYVLPFLTFGSEPRPRARNGS